jgi:hypothetical protein
LVEFDIKKAIEIGKGKYVYITYINGRYIRDPVTKDYILKKDILEISLNNTGV